MEIKIDANVDELNAFIDSLHEFISSAVSIGAGLELPEDGIDVEPRYLSPTHYMYVFRPSESLVRFGMRLRESARFEKSEKSDQFREELLALIRKYDAEGFHEQGDDRNPSEAGFNVGGVEIPLYKLGA